MKISFLGSSSALSTEERDNTAMVVEINGEILLIDCNGSPVKKISQLGYDFTKIDNILITHDHPDHIYGLPSILHEMLLKGRRRTLNIYSPSPALKLIRPFLKSLFDVEEDMFDYKLVDIKLEENILVLDTPKYSIYATKVEHGDGTIGYKIIEKGGKSFVYSADTKPCNNLLKFARNTDLLIHEATFSHQYVEEAEKGGHTTSYQAGEIAKKANVRKLVLTHFDPLCSRNSDLLLNEAKIEFDGEIIISFDLMSMEV